MYYVMECEPLIREDGGAVLSLNNSFKLAGIRLWKTGSPIKDSRKKNIPDPVLLDFDAFGGYDGFPPEIEDLGIPVMSRRLCQVLTDAGVDSMELFPAKLTNNQTGRVFDYTVYNILGLVSAKDLNEESKAGDQKLFRLAENVNTIVVHESVKSAVEAAGISSVTLIRLEDYS